MDIGKRIRLRREELGYTQEELAFKLGYKSRSSVNKVENTRELSLKKVDAFAKALECTPSHLLGWEDELLEKQYEDYIFPQKIKVYESFGYEGYYLIEAISIVDDSKKKELFNFAKFLVSDNEKKEDILSEDEIKEIIKNSFFDNRDFDKIMIDYKEKFGDDECYLNAAHERTDIEATDEMKKHDDSFFDEED